MTTRLSYVDGSVEPVDKASVKLAARIDTDALDEDLDALITAAREQAEHITGRCYRAQVLRAELADWPLDTDAIAVHGATACEVSYWTGSDWSSPLGSAAYVFAPGGIGNNGTVLAPAIGASWPNLADRAVGPRVRIDLTAGPGVVPEAAKLYIRASVAAWVKTPEALSGGNLAAHPLYERLLDSQKLYG